MPWVTADFLGKKVQFSNEKTRFALWAEEDTLKLVRDSYRQDNCKTQSEFIEKAVRFYTGYLHAKEDTYLPGILSDILEGTLGIMANRIGKLLFKQSVELGILSHIIAADTDVDQATLQRLRGRCVNDVKRTNGQIEFKDILQFQREA